MHLSIIYLFADYEQNISAPIILNRHLENVFNKYVCTIPITKISVFNTINKQTGSAYSAKRLIRDAANQVIPSLLPDNLAVGDAMHR